MCAGLSKVRLTQRPFRDHRLGRPCRAPSRSHEPAQIVLFGALVSTPRCSQRHRQLRPPAQRGPKPPSPPKLRSRSLLVTRSSKYAFTSSPLLFNSSAILMRSSMMDAISSRENPIGPPVAPPSPGSAMGRPSRQRVDILRPEGLDPVGQLHGLDSSLPDCGDERGRSHAGGPDRVGWI